MLKKTIFYSLMIAFIGLGLLSCDQAEPVAEISKPAPDFTLKDSHGTVHHLSDFKGKTVVLEWTNHLCPFVIKYYQKGHMQTLQQNAANNDVIWLSIISSAPGKQGYVNGDEANAVANKVASKAHAILLDSSGDVGRRYGAKTTPHMYVINAKGILVYQGAIDSIRSADTNDIATATNYVSAALDAIYNKTSIQHASTSPYGCSVKY